MSFACSLPPARRDEKRFLDRGVRTSWASRRKQVSTRQVVTVSLPMSNGRVLRVRRSSAPEEIHRGIRETLDKPSKAVTPVRTWAEVHGR
jgi:hypothetical protein